jgi:hypothetical protein
MLTACKSSAKEGLSSLMTQDHAEPTWLVKLADRIALIGRW